MKTLQQIITKKDQDQMIKAFENMADAKKFIRNRIAEDMDFAKYLHNTKVSDFALDLFGKEYIDKNPLYIKGIKTPLCDALYYAKKLAKVKCKKEEPTKEEPTKEEPTKEEPTIKTLVQVIQELTYIENNWSKFEKSDKESIKLALDRLSKLK